MPVVKIPCGQPPPITVDCIRIASEAGMPSPWLTRHATRLFPLPRPAVLGAYLSGLREAERLRGLLGKPGSGSA